MSAKERLAAVFEAILDRLDDIEGSMSILPSIERNLKAVVQVAVDTRESLDSLRGAVLDELDRSGIARKRDLARVQALESRVERLEQQPPQAAE